MVVCCLAWAASAVDVTSVGAFGPAGSGQTHIMSITNPTLNRFTVEITLDANTGE